MTTEFPPIKVTRRDLASLRQLVEQAKAERLGTAEYLAREIERAQIVAHSDMLDELVMMGSRIEYLDNSSGEIRTTTLVYPGDADLEKLSVLTPIGAALLGLSVGQTIRYPVPPDEWRSLTVLEVKNDA